MILSVFGKISPGSRIMFTFKSRVLRVCTQIPYSLATTCLDFALIERDSMTGSRFISILQGFICHDISIKNKHWQYVADDCQPCFLVLIPSSSCESHIAKQ